MLKISEVGFIEKLLTQDSGNIMTDIGTWRHSTHVLVNLKILSAWEVIWASLAKEHHQHICGRETVLL